MSFLHLDLLTYPFYPRPVLVFGYCRCLRQSVQARTTKFGQKVQNNLVKVPIVLGGDWPLPSRSNLAWKSKFTPFWACPRHNSPSIQARTTKFGQKMQTTCLWSLLFWGRLTATFMVKFNSLTGWWNLVWVKIGTCVTLTILTKSASWVGPSLLDGFTVPWIHHGTENCTYFMHTLLYSQTLNCNLFNHIKSPLFSLIHSVAVYFRVVRMADACTIR